MADDSAGWIKGLGFPPAGRNNFRIAPPGPSSNRLSRAVERWFLELRDPLVRYLRTLGCRHSLAEEFTQEAFLRLHQAMSGGLEVNDVRAWVFRVARNMWIDNRREHQRYWTTDHHDDERAELEYTDPTPDPEQQVLGSERIRLIEQETLRLPELQRECIYLKAQGLRYHQIAVALDISMTTAVDSVRQAVKRIARRFND